MNTIGIIRQCVAITTIAGALFVAAEAGATKGVTAAQKVANQMKGVSDYEVREFGEFSARASRTRIEVWRTADKKRNTVWSFTTVEWGKRGLDPIAGNPRYVQTVMGRGRVFHEGGVSIDETRDGVTVVMKQKREAGRFQKKQPWLTLFSSGNTTVTYDHESGHASATEVKSKGHLLTLQGVPVPYGLNFSQPATHEQLEQGIRSGPGNHTRVGRDLEFGAMLSGHGSTPSSTAGTFQYTFAQGGPDFLKWMDGNHRVAKQVDMRLRFATTPVTGRKVIPITINPASPVTVKNIAPSSGKK